MVDTTSRRAFLRGAVAAGAALGYGLTVPSSGAMPRAQDTAAGAGPGAVPLPPDIEPLVRLIEDTPRDKLIEAVAALMREGLSYHQIVSALMLAGVRNVQPRPSVGFKFHAVLVVHSAHLACLAAADADRWIPLYWALDYFKEAQARDVQEGDWTLGPVDESAVPAAHDAHEAFVAAMDAWDEAAADGAVAGLARHAGAQEVCELFFRYGCRDFRSIGHKAIYVANARRTLECIGWRHAEPVLRSLAYALLNHHGEPNPSQHELEPDGIGRRNERRVTDLRADWYAGPADDRATSELLEVLRSGSPDEAADHAVRVLNRGVGPQAVWDAVFVGAGELLLRQPGIVALHAVTTSNALHYASRTSGEDRTRRLLLLQNVAFLPLFRRAMASRGNVGNDRADTLSPLAPASGLNGAWNEVLADVTADPLSAARKVLAVVRDALATEFVARARHLICQKGSDSHDYKFSAAAFEDYPTLSPRWQARFLATTVFQLRGSADPDNPLVERIQGVLQS